MKLYRSNTVDPQAYTAAYTAWYSRLTTQQQAALYHYTDSGYRSLNHNLRYGKPLAAAEVEMSEHLDAALAISTTSLMPRSLYRGVKTLREMPTTGQRINYPFFLSTSSDPHQLFKFVDQNNPVIFEIDAVNGTETSDIHPEFEFLLPRDSTFTVTEVLNDVAWHAEYPGTDHSRALHGATVIRMTQHDDTAGEAPQPRR